MKIFLAFSIVMGKNYLSFLYESDFWIKEIDFIGYGNRFEEPMMESIQQAAEVLSKSAHAIALTGAGISVESGIPPFRGKGGLWEKYDIEEYATIDVFLTNPGKAWILLKELGETCVKASPNDAHKALAELEEMGRLSSVITQNIDGLHHKAGSNRVIEFHGSYKTMTCTSCRKSIDSDTVNLNVMPPLCECKGILKPDVVLFGEPIPADAIRDSFQEASLCDTLLVIGTSAVVMPASQIPLIAKQHRATVIEINMERTVLTNSISDIFLEGSAAQILPQITKFLKQ